MRKVRTFKKKFSVLEVTTTLILVLTLVAALAQLKPVNTVVTTIMAKAWPSR